MVEPPSLISRPSRSSRVDVLSETDRRKSRQFRCTCPIRTTVTTSCINRIFVPIETRASTFEPHHLPCDKWSSPRFLFSDLNIDDLVFREKMSRDQNEQYFRPEYQNSPMPLSYSVWGPHQVDGLAKWAWPVYLTNRLIILDYRTDRPNTDGGLVGLFTKKEPTREASCFCF